MITKRLQKVGTSLALVIDKPVLALLGITDETDLEITTDGRGLRIVPAPRRATPEEAKAAMDKIFKTHHELFAKLAK